jgi:hypothetical protein
MLMHFFDPVLCTIIAEKSPVHASICERDAALMCRDLNAGKPVVVEISEMLCDVRAEVVAVFKR